MDATTTHPRQHHLRQARLRHHHHPGRGRLRRRLRPHLPCLRRAPPRVVERHRPAVLTVPAPARPGAAGRASAEHPTVIQTGQAARDVSGRAQSLLGVTNQPLPGTRRISPSSASTRIALPAVARAMP